MNFILVRISFSRYHINNETIMSVIKFVTSLSVLTSLFAVITIQVAVAQNYQLSLQGQRFSAHQAATPLESSVKIPAKTHITLSQSGAFKQFTSTFFQVILNFVFSRLAIKMAPPFLIYSAGVVVLNTMYSTQKGHQKHVPKHFFGA